MTSKEYLDTYKQVDELTLKIMRYNSKLCEMYPFLLPRGIILGEEYSTYDYSYTLFDKMPAPWRIAFGDALLKDLVEQLTINNNVYNYRIHDIIDIDNCLVIFDNGLATKEWYTQIFPKYQDLSKQIKVY